MNIHPFTIIIDYIQTWASHGGYAFLFFISILEAIPILGTTIPGHTAVILSGFLAKIGLFNIWIVMFLASFGAVLGDMVGFYLGKRYGAKFTEKFSKSNSFWSESIEKTKALVGHHTGKALIIGRFNPLTRPFMPFVVGMSHAPVGKFWFYNIVGGVAWAVLSVAIGYIFGAGYHAAAAYFGKAAVIATVVAIVIAWGYRFANKRFHVFRRYELFMLIISLISFWGLMETIQDTWSKHSSLAILDTSVSLFFEKHVSILAVYVSKFIGLYGGWIISVAAILVFVALVIRKRWRSSAIMLVSISSTVLFVELFKAFFLRSRPDNALVFVADPSFPSFHAAVAAAFFVSAAYLFAQKRKVVINKEIFIFACFISFAIVGLSRLVLNVHWLSDVLAGWSLGIFCASASVLLVRYANALYPKR